MSGPLDDLAPPSSLDDLPPPSALDHLAPPQPTGWTMGKPGAGVTTGLGEGALALGTGTIGALAAGGMGWLEKATGKSWDQIQADQDALRAHIQYQPQTTIGKGIAEAGGWVGGKLDELGAWAAEHAGNLAEAAGADPDTVAAIKTGTHATTMALAPKAAGTVAGAGLGAIKSVAGAAADVASGVLRRTGETAPLFQPEAAGAQTPGASVGAAGATATGRMSTASPDLAAGIASKIADAQARFGPAWKENFNADAMDRMLEADSLGAATGAPPGRLTEGQASGDAVLISNELNNRGTATDMAKFYQWQKENMAQHLQAIRDNAGPDVTTTTPTDHAQTLIDAYKAKYEPRSADIDSDWDAIRAQSNGAPIFDAGRMLQDAQAALKQKLLSSQDPGGQLAELTDAARRGGLTADGYNNFRQNLGKIAMKGGTEGDAASTIIQATNASELLPQATQFRGMVNDALAKGRALHADLEADPAYDAAVNGTVSANDFVNKFLVRGKVENIAQMVKNIGDDNVANQTMKVAMLDHLRQSAGLNDQYQGNFAADSFNKQLAAIGQRAGPIFQSGELPTLQSLGNYARNATFRPGGNFANTSNTAVAAPGILKHAAGAVGAAAESLVNKAAPVVGPMVTGGLRARAARVAAAQQELQNAQFVQQATEPGAGVIRR